jgi:hypothetical protein
MGIRNAASIVVKHRAPAGRLTPGNLGFDFTDEELQVAGRQLFDIIYNSYPGELHELLTEHPELEQDLLGGRAYGDLREDEEFFHLPETLGVALGVGGLRDLLEKHNPMRNVLGQDALYVNLSRESRALALAMLGDAILVTYMDGLGEPKPYGMAQIVPEGNGYGLKIILRDGDGNLATDAEGFRSILELLQLVANGRGRRMFLREDNPED